MAYGKRFDEWDRASLIMSLLHNAPLSGRPFRSPESFNPFLTAAAADHAAACTISSPADLVALIGGTLGKVH